MAKTQGKIHVDRNAMQYLAYKEKIAQTHKVRTTIAKLTNLSLDVKAFKD